MQDLNQRLEQLCADAADCTYIASVSEDKEKRELFALLAANMSELAKQVEDLISASRACEEPEAADTPVSQNIQSRQPNLVGDARGDNGRRSAHSHEASPKLPSHGRAD
jgi:hypothetical protein